MEGGQRWPRRERYSTRALSPSASLGVKHVRALAYAFDRKQPRGLRLVIGRALRIFVQWFSVQWTRSFNVSNVRSPIATYAIDCVLCCRFYITAITVVVINISIFVHQHIARTCIYKNTQAEKQTRSKKPTIMLYVHNVSSNNRVIQGGPKKVSHYRESSLNHGKIRH